MKMRNLEVLGKDAGPAKTYWRRICNKSPDAVRLLQAYAILGDPVPDDVVEQVSEVDSATRKHLLADGYLQGLLRKEDNCQTIRDPILKDYILRQIGGEEKQHYIERVVEVYRDQLKAGKDRESMAAVILPPFVLKAKGSEAFVKVLLDDGCFSVILKHRLFAPAITFYEQALQMVMPDSKQEAALKHYRGLTYHMNKELPEAKTMYIQALEICKKLNWLERMSSIYSNLALVYAAQSNLYEAEDLLQKSLKIDEQLGKSSRLASCYGLLAIVYRRRGEFDKAEQTAHKSLELAEQNGSKEEMGRQYNSLGLIYLQQYKLDEAEQMFRKGLEIDQQSDRLIGLASEYANLGWVYKARQDTETAKKYWQEAKLLFGKLGIDYLPDIDE